MSLKNSLTPTGIDPGTFRLVAQRLNHYATLGPIDWGHFMKVYKGSVDMSIRSYNRRYVEGRRNLNELTAAFVIETGLFKKFSYNSLFSDILSL
jgi:hypothetical protein